MKNAMHRACTTCAQAVHRFGVYILLSLVLAGCANVAGVGRDPALIRNPTVPIGAILRFDPAKFDGNWSVYSTAGGDWTLTGFTVAGRGTRWREPGRRARITPRATGILQLTYAGGARRDLWVIWTDPDHHTVALGTPGGGFGFIATRAGRFRADQVAAAGRVLDFNGYRTAEWKVRQ